MEIIVGLGIGLAVLIGLGCLLFLIALGKEMNR